MRPLKVNAKKREKKLAKFLTKNSIREKKKNGAAIKERCIDIENRQVERGRNDIVNGQIESNVVVVHHVDIVDHENIECGG